MLPCSAALSQFGTLIYVAVLASSFMWERLCVCDALVCVQMFVDGSLWDEKLSAILFYLRDVRGMCPRELLNRKVMG